MLQIALDHLSLGESSQIRTKSIQLQYSRSLLSKMINSKMIQNNLINIPSLCEVLAKSSKSICNNIAILEQVKLFSKSINAFNFIH